MEKVKIKIGEETKEIDLEDKDAALIITLQELTHTLRMGKWAI